MTDSTDPTHPALPPATNDRHLSRRRVLAAGLAVAGIGLVGVGGYAVVDRVRTPSEGPSDWLIPNVATGTVTLESVQSRARGRAVDLFTAVPAGLGDGAGLPVCLILHGASGRPTDYSMFGFPQLLTDAVQRGVAPFVLAGADGGSQSWQAVGADDPQAMVVDEMPGWLADRGFDSTRLVGWGWSMGGFGVLRLAEDHRGFVSAVAAFSPAVSIEDSVSADTDALAGTPLAIWCGTDDPFYDAVKTLVTELPEPLAAGSYGAGEAHTRSYWNSITPAAFDFLGAQLSS